MVMHLVSLWEMSKIRAFVHHLKTSYSRTRKWDPSAAPEKFRKLSCFWSILSSSSKVLGVGNFASERMLLLQPFDKRRTCPSPKTGNWDKPGGSWIEGHIFPLYQVKTRMTFYFSHQTCLGQIPNDSVRIPIVLPNSVRTRTIVLSISSHFYERQSQRSYVLML